VSRITPTAILVNSALQREGITSLLQGTSYKIVAAAGRPNELTDHDFAKGRRALAIIVIDSENGNLNQTAESISRLRSLTPPCKVVLIAEANRTFDLPSVLALAPDGYILNVGSRGMLLRSLGMICTSNQQVFVFGTLPDGHVDRVDFDANRPVVGYQPWSSYGLESKTKSVGLSHRECQVLICLARGETNKQIARLCHISAATVKVHLKAILRKTSAKNRTQAAIWAIEHGRWNSTFKENADTRTYCSEAMPDQLSLSFSEPKARSASQSGSQQFAAVQQEESLPGDAGPKVNERSAPKSLIGKEAIPLRAALRFRTKDPTHPIAGQTQRPNVK
jgi:two-component system, NarL family, nitrate/nitrite response regulator NarL